MGSSLLTRWYFTAISAKATCQIEVTNFLFNMIGWLDIPVPILPETPSPWENPEGIRAATASRSWSWYLWPPSIRKGDHNFLGIYLGKANWSWYSMGPRSSLHFVVGVFAIHHRANINKGKRAWCLPSIACRAYKTLSSILGYIDRPSFATTSSGRLHQEPPGFWPSSWTSQSWSSPLGRRIHRKPAGMQTTLNTIFITCICTWALSLFTRSISGFTVGMSPTWLLKKAKTASQLSAYICIWFEFHMKGLNDNTLLAGVGGTTGSRPIGFVGTSLEFKNLIDLYPRAQDLYAKKCTNLRSTRLRIAFFIL